MMMCLFLRWSKSPQPQSSNWKESLNFKNPYWNLRCQHLYSPKEQSRILHRDLTRTNLPRKIINQTPSLQISSPKSELSQGRSPRLTEITGIRCNRKAAWSREIVRPPRNDCLSMIQYRWKWREIQSSMHTVQGKRFHRLREVIQ